MKKLALIVLAAASLVGTAGVASAQYGGGYYGDRYYGDRYRERYYDDDRYYRRRHIPRLKGCRLLRTRLSAGLQRTGLRLQAISRLLKLISELAPPTSAASPGDEENDATRGLLTRRPRSAPARRIFWPLGPVAGQLRFQR